MKFSFDPHGRLIWIKAEIAGPALATKVFLAMDTAASQSLINTSVLMSIGYDVESLTSTTNLTTGSDEIKAPIVLLVRIKALGREKVNLPVLCHELPPMATIDGLLGLDFLKPGRLTIDLTGGWIELQES